MSYGCRKASAAASSRVRLAAITVASGLFILQGRRDPWLGSDWVLGGMIIPGLIVGIVIPYLRGGPSVFLAHRPRYTLLDRLGPALDRPRRVRLLQGLTEPGGFAHSARRPGSYSFGNSIGASRA